jgi:2-amino-4-hydroxy-6-hydroxymethyldihydropteridine diphosphokinase
MHPADRLEPAHHLRRERVRAYVALGANLGDARSSVLTAMQALDAAPGTRVTARSGLYRSAPLGAGGPDYINAVVRLCTRLSAPDLLKLLQRLEQDAGRTRPYHHAPRTLDLDLLRYGEARIDSPHLTVPHPRLRERAFVLLPLAEIDPPSVSAGELAAVRGQRIERIG